MKLSDAIALGRVLINPVRFRLLTDNGKSGCALGMAGIAAGLKLHRFPACDVIGIHIDAEDNYEVIYERWPWLAQEEIPEILPCGHSAAEDCQDFEDIIIHLFDVHVGGDWTLDRLIDWIQSAEPEEDANTPPREELKEVEENLINKR